MAGFVKTIQTYLGRALLDTDAIAALECHAHATTQIRLGTLIPKPSLASGGEEAVSDYIDPQRRALESRKAGLCCCHRCLDERREMRAWMVVCPICGNKRCPKASNHDLLCTASNEPGQPGSVY